MSVRYLTPASLGKILFNVGPLCTALISTIFSLDGSTHKFTLPLVLSELGQSSGTSFMTHSHSFILLFAASVVHSPPPLGIPGVYMLPPLGSAWYG